MATLGGTVPMRYRPRWCVRDLVDGSLTMNLKGSFGKFLHEVLYWAATWPFRVFGLELMRPMTLLDYVWRIDNSKSTTSIAELLNQHNPMLDDLMPWMGGNQGVGHRVGPAP